ncbi:IS6 family transposase, partial [Rhodococcus jostii]
DDASGRCKRFASPGQAQRFLSAFGGIAGHFQVRRHLLTASEWRREMTDRFAVWNEVTGVSAAA